MAFLIEGLNSNTALSLDMFYPESFRNLDELIVIPEENLVVVKERWSGKSCDTFFNLQTLERTDPFKRYNQENGKAFIEQIDNLTIVTIVNVEHGTMTEYLIGAVFKDNRQIFKSISPRYCSTKEISTYQKYLNAQSYLNMKSKKHEELFTEFSNLSFDDKVIKIREIFRSNFRSNCEIGYFPPEYFLTQELFNLLDQDIKFREVLFEILKLEESSTNQAASLVYECLIVHYTKGG